MTEQKANKDIVKEQNSEKQALMVAIWLLICIVMIIIGFFISNSPWTNLFYWVAAFFGGCGFGLRFSKDANDKDVGAFFLIVASIITFINSLVISAGLFVLIATALFIRYTIVLKKSLSTEKTPEETDEEIQVINELPEEDEPEVDAEKLVCNGKLDLSMCLTWFAQRGKKHNIEQTEWHKIRQELIYFKHRLAESTLYLGVIGDASVGKSTFINALLGFEFLKENVTLGTTSTATILRYGNEFSIKINYTDSTPSVSYNTKDLNLPKNINFTEYSPELAEAIAKFTAIEKEEDAAGIRSVEIFIPVKNDLLESNVAIVDTPGLHSGNEWHDKATTNAVKNICDIALILTSAKTPLPKNFIEYLNKNLASVLPRSILVMTQADTLDEDEREDQLDYIHCRLKKETKSDVAGCFGVSAYYALERTSKRQQTSEDIENYRNEFDVMKNSLKKYLQDGHETALHDSLQDFVQNNFLPVMEQVLLDRKQILQQRKDELQKNKLSNLDKFITERIKKISLDISKNKIPEGAIERELQDVAAIFENTAITRIINADSKDELKSAMAEEKIKRDVEALMPALAKAINKLCSPLKSSTRKGIDNFANEFKDAYSRLQNINSLKVSDVNFSNISVKIDSIDLPMNYFTNVIEAQNSADNAKVGGGAAGGAAIGFLIGGPLGALVGGLGGAIFGALFGKSLATLKEEAKGTVRQISNSWQNQMKEHAIRACSENMENCQGFAAQAIQKYADTYEEQIKSIIAAEKKEQSKLSKNINSIEDDMEILINLGEKNEQ